MSKDKEEIDAEMTQYTIKSVEYRQETQEIETSIGQLQQEKIVRSLHVDIISYYKLAAMGRKT